MDSGNEQWQFNYFNYFTEVEERFQKARGTGLFLVSPLDWALIESWKTAGIPLEAVLRGIDLAFEKWHAQKKRGRMVNSLAYCAQAVVEEAERMAGGEAAGGGAAEAPFSKEEVEQYLQRSLNHVRSTGIAELAGVVESLEECIRESERYYRDLQELEQRLTGLEDKMIAVARLRQSEQQLIDIRTELDRQLQPYRGKMTTPQLQMLEKQYLDRTVLERTSLPRLSLFYLK